jgi:hypothetical protein
MIAQTPKDMTDAALSRAVVEMTNAPSATLWVFEVTDFNRAAKMSRQHNLSAP